MRVSLPVRILARCFLAHGMNAEAFIEAASHALGRPWPWLRPLASRLAKEYAGGSRPREREVAGFLWHDRRLRHILRREGKRIKVVSAITGPQEMHAVRAAAGWNLPALPTVHDVAMWLQVTLSELAWFADLKALNAEAEDEKLRHYHYKPMLKRSGAARLIESPKPRLKELQRQILREILNGVPPHESVHGFVQSRSVKSFATPHAGQAVVLRMDIEDFFPSFSRGRIQSFFRTAGYPEAVADLLGGVCCNTAPRDLWDSADVNLTPEERAAARILYGRPHLPQGAPTSPALANICSYRLDCRLRGLAASAGAHYSRYADDLAFSGDRAFERNVENFASHVAVIAAEEGFRINHRKTRMMGASVRQRLAGVVCNTKPNVSRTQFDVLKATLTNCVRYGPESQNRTGHAAFRQHLEGRVAYCEMLNADKARRLRRLLEQIVWTNLA